MSRQANPTLIGIFVLGAIILGIISILLLAGGEWFQKHSQHIMYFDEAAQGLKEGAPVVFLGVKIGSVKTIQLGLNERNKRFVVPVTIEIEPHLVQTSTGMKIDLQDRKTIRQLIDQGLRARLKVQNLLTGQLYIDLNLYPEKPARMLSNDPAVSEIPTISTTFKELTSVLEEFPIEEFLADVAAIGTATKKILTNEAMNNIPHQLEAILSNLESLSSQLQKESGSILIEARKELIELHKAIYAVQNSMVKVGNAADRVEEWAGEDSKIYNSITRAGTELADAAQKLQFLTDQESPAVQRLDMALVEISRAARAIRMMAETLEQQPESIIRGKSDRKK